MSYAFLSQTMQMCKEFGKGTPMEKRNKESAFFACCQNAQVISVYKVSVQGQCLCR